MADYVMDLDTDKMVNFLKWKVQDSPEDFENELMAQGDEDELRRYAEEVVKAVETMLDEVMKDIGSMTNYLGSNKGFMLPSFLAPKERVGGLNGTDYSSFLDLYVGQAASISLRGNVVTYHTTSGDRIEFWNLSTEED